MPSWRVQGRFYLDLLLIIRVRWAAERPRTRQWQYTELVRNICPEGTSNSVVVRWISRRNRPICSKQQTTRDSKCFDEKMGAVKIISPCMLTQRGRESNTQTRDGRTDILMFLPVYMWMPTPPSSRLLGLRVRIPPGIWMSVSCECCLLSGRGLCEGLIPRPEGSYRMWCVWVWWWGLDSEGALAR
jgi:hypothetical protein